VIDERAFVHPTAKIAANVTVGPWAYIGENVSIEEGTTIAPHVVIKGPTQIGKNNKIFQFASIGEQPQDKKYNNEPTELIIGDDNVIREYCNFNRGTVHGGGVTEIGSRNLFMANVHIAHDCQVGDHIVDDRLPAGADGKAIGIETDCVPDGVRAGCHRRRVRGDRLGLHLGTGPQQGNGPHCRKLAP